MVTALRKKVYTLDKLRDKTRALIDEGFVDRQRPIYTLCRYIPGGKWRCFGVELEENEFCCVTISLICYLG